MQFKINVLVEESLFVCVYYIDILPQLNRSNPLRMIFTNVLALLGKIYIFCDHPN